ncbi:MAG: HAMP domain-containing sensor histidine kinase [Methylococcaceae bacterium]
MSWFDTHAVSPHGYCLLWQPQLIALHVITQTLIAIAYIIIPIIICLVVRKKSHIENKRFFYLFSLFIFACAINHIMAIIVIWYPYYVLQGLTMAVTALTALITVWVLWRSIPDLIKLPSVQLLQQVNAQLTQEIERRKVADENLHTLNETLEKRVASEVKNNREKDLLLIQQSRLAAMGEMIGNIAHQWRQPINALNLVLMNIADAYQYNELTPEVLDKQIAKGERLVEAMSGTIDDFRNFFKSESSQELFEINSSVHDTIGIIEASCRNHNIIIEVIETDSLKMLGFPGQYRQALLNIMGNAKDILIERKINHGKITVQLNQQNEKAIVSIADNAGGIEESVIAKVFDPYFTTRVQGNGIGLYMTKMIIENNMHGSVSAQNSNNGAVFIIETPLAK